MDPIDRRTEFRPPSWRARLLDTILRMTAKRALFRNPSVASMRVHAARLERWLAREVRDATITPAPLATCDAQWVAPRDLSCDRVILYLPGGGFMMRTPAVHRALAARLAYASGARVLLVFYRLAPEHPYPAGRDDAVAAYERLLAEGVAPERIVFGGDSAGGNLVLSTLFRLRERGLPLPAGAFLLSPATDLRVHEEGSRLANREADAMLAIDLARMVLTHYLGGREEMLTDPGVSPLLGDFRGLPPLLFQVGGTEILLDDSRHAARRAAEAGIPVELEVWDGMPHVWQAMAQLPEAREATARIGEFVRRRATTGARAVPPSPSSTGVSPMLGLMQDAPLLISTLIRHADRHHGHVEVVSRRVEGDIHRYTYRDLHRRAKRVANVLDSLGVGMGERVATLAWNGYRHLELYFGVSGKGAVLHTVNPRLIADQVAWIANHAEDKCLFFDLTFLPIVEKIAAQCTTVKHFVLMTDRAHMPANTSVAGLLCYEDLLAGASDEYRWPVFDENQASSICFTSGTTGNPKGVVYSHRSTLLHTLVIAQPDALAVSAREVILPVVPMFHVNAWGLPYAAAMGGAKLVFPGAALDGKSLYELIEAEGVTVSAGVPTVWQGLLNHVEKNGLRFATMRRTIVGGAALPPAMLRSFEEQFNVEALHAWGMTEMSPVGTACALRAEHAALTGEERFAVKSKQGRAVYGVDMKIVDAEGKELPWDGKHSGDLLVRGPWIVSQYLKGDGGDPLVEDAEGLKWFPTGDVATIDAGGYMQITDRSKDVIKSGGEWISSIDIENVAVSHPAVAMAACIGVRHPKWDERPLLVVLLKEGASATREEILHHYEGKVAKWQIPDDVVFVEAMPLGATGKMQKNRLRERFGEHFQTAA